MEWNEWFEYKNGELYWKKSNTRGPIKAGSIAGSRTNTGYLKVSLKGKSGKRVLHFLIKFDMIG